MWMAVLHEIVTGLALIDCVWKSACYTSNLEPWMLEQVAEQEMPYIRNGIPFAFFTFLAHPALAYRKLNTQIFNEWSTQHERTIIQLLIICNSLLLTLFTTWSWATIIQWFSLVKFSYFVLFINYISVNVYIYEKKLGIIISAFTFTVI